MFCGRKKNSSLVDVLSFRAILPVLEEFDEGGLYLLVEFGVGGNEAL
jgi:hypothetical protein